MMRIWATLSLALLLGLPANSRGTEDDFDILGLGFRDCADCPLMIEIPRGAFTMGSSEGEADELPRNKIVIRQPFALGVYPITVDEFAAFVAETNYRIGQECRDSYALGSVNVSVPEGRVARDVGGWRAPGFEQTGMHPVVCVNLFDAQAYLDWMNEKTGGGYRLPSEAEWEYAARAGTRSKRFWGDEEPVCQRGQPNAAVTLNCGDLSTRPVGFSAANAFGLHDMLGNVYEWTADCEMLHYLDGPFDQAAFTKDDCDSRTTRGGAWDADPFFARSANRGGAPNAFTDNALGFRVAKDL